MINQYPEYPKYKGITWNKKHCIKIKQKNPNCIKMLQYYHICVLSLIFHSWEWNISCIWLMWLVQVKICLRYCNRWHPKTYTYRKVKLLLCYLKYVCELKYSLSVCQRTYNLYLISYLSKCHHFVWAIPITTIFDFCCLLLYYHFFVNKKNSNIYKLSHIRNMGTSMV